MPQALRCLNRFSQVYSQSSSAGSRDSSLTNHGVLQAKRLGEHLATRSPAIGPVTHIYASNLQRAVRTAQAIAAAQSNATGGSKNLEVVEVPELREKDFGSDEGKRFGTRGSDRAAAPASSTVDFVPSESRDSMKIRADRFIDTVLVPVVSQATPQVAQRAIVIVAHGIILNVLLSCLLSRFGPGEVARFSRPGDAPWRSEWLAAWSNTGYLEAALRVASPVAESASDDKASSYNAHNELGERTENQLGTEQVSAAHTGHQDSTVIGDETASISPSVEAASSSSPSLGLSRAAAPIIQLSVQTVNCIEHLQGLKKTRGGIGSAASDSKQKTMDSFFSRPAKKPKTDV